MWDGPQFTLVGSMRGTSEGAGDVATLVEEGGPLPPPASVAFPSVYFAAAVRSVQFILLLNPGSGVLSTSNEGTCIYYGLKRRDTCTFTTTCACEVPYAAPVGNNYVKRSTPPLKPCEQRPSYKRRGIECRGHRFGDKAAHVHHVHLPRDAHQFHRRFPPPIPVGCDRVGEKTTVSYTLRSVPGSILTVYAFLLMVLFSAVAVADHLGMCNS